MILGAPAFIDPPGDFPERNIDSEFQTLTDDFGLVRKKLGEERCSRPMDGGREQAPVEGKTAP